MEAGNLTAAITDPFTEAVTTVPFDRLPIDFWVPYDLNVLEPVISWGHS